MRRSSPLPVVEDVESTSYAFSTTKLHVVGAPRSRSSRGRGSDNDDDHEQRVGVGGSGSGTHDGLSGQRRRRQQQQQEYEQPQRVNRSSRNNNTSRRKMTTKKNTSSGAINAITANSTTSSNVASRWIMVLICLFVLADIIYLYKISTNALLLHPVGAGLKTKQSMRMSSTTSSHLEQQQQQQEILQPPLLLNHDNQIHDDDGDDDVEKSKNNNTTKNRNDDGKERIYEILHQAGINVQTDLNQETIDSLPTWDMITKLFGTGPRIMGLERCDEFRTNTDPTIRFFGIAGTFNSGTNLLSELMIQNCQITERMVVYGNKSKGIRWQGK